MPPTRAPTAPPTAGASDLPSRLRLSVTRLARRLRQEASGEGSLTPTMLAALSTVESLGPMTLGELAEAERIQPPTVTRIAARLEKAGLIGRRCDAGDRRVNRVEVTGAGRAVLARTRTRKDAYLASRLDRLSPAERDILVRALPVLERLLEEEG